MCFHMWDPVETWDHLWGSELVVCLCTAGSRPHRSFSMTLLPLLIFCDFVADVLNISLRSLETRKEPKDGELGFKKAVGESNRGQANLDFSRLMDVKFPLVTKLPNH